jgi:FAD:protein FMN transferase
VVAAITDARLRYRSRVWSTGVDLLVTDSSSLIPAVEVLHEELARTDRMANRFRPDSEIGRVNGSSGRPVSVSDEFLHVLGVADRVYAATGGAVDPTVGGALCRLGYDRDFADVPLRAPAALPPPATVPGWRSVSVDETERTVAVPPGCVMDLGSTAKALTADRVARRAADRVGCGVMVAIGGDVAVAGEPPEDGFPIGVADRWDDGEPSVVVAVRSGGLATSGTAARRWTVGGHEVHHVIDPMTGLPALSPWRTATVAAASCVDANAASTAALVKGSSAVEWLTWAGLSARLVAGDGAVVHVGGWPVDTVGASR